MSKVAEEVFPRQRKGVYVVIDVTCRDDDELIFAEKHELWLPQSTYKAALALRDRLNANRLKGIDDKDCYKHVKFMVKNTQTTPGFEFLVNTLKKSGVEVEVVNEQDTA
jgi:DNA/RNA endonuclease G (NUC1)